MRHNMTLQRRNDAVTSEWRRHGNQFRKDTSYLNKYKNTLYQHNE